MDQLSDDEVKTLSVRQAIDDWNSWEKGYLTYDFTSGGSAARIAWKGVQSSIHMTAAINHRLDMMNLTLLRILEALEKKNESGEERKV